MTREEVLAEIKAKCQHCAAGNPARPHLGGVEWIHNFVKGVQHSVTMCQATDLRVQHKDLLNG